MQVERRIEISNRLQQEINALIGSQKTEIHDERRRWWDSQLLFEPAQVVDSVADRGVKAFRVHAVGNHAYALSIHPELSLQQGS